jgi:hypothetical protein
MRAIVLTGLHDQGLADAGRHESRKRTTVARATPATPVTVPEAGPA